LTAVVEAGVFGLQAGKDFLDVIDGLKVETWDTLLIGFERTQRGESCPHLR